MRSRRFQRTDRAAGVLLVAALLAFFLLSPVRAQETPDATPQETSQETVVRIEVDPQVQPVPKGEEFEARVLVDNVEHLAGFDFTIEYDPDRLEPVEEEPAQEETPGPALVQDVTTVRVLDLGQFLASGERGESMTCPSHFADENTVAVFCVTASPPVCAGGLPGASGSGLLGRVVFKSKGGEVASLKLADTNLVLDDIEGCDLENVTAEPISHRREDATVTLTGGGGSPWALIGIIIGVVAVVVIGGGAAGYVWYQRRGAGTSP